MSSIISVGRYSNTMLREVGIVPESVEKGMRVRYTYAGA